MDYVGEKLQGIILTQSSKGCAETYNGKSSIIQVVRYKRCQMHERCNIGNVRCKTIKRIEKKRLNIKYCTIE